MYGSSIFQWKSIWRNLSFKYIQINERQFLFKYLHEIIPTGKRMSTIGQGSPDCKYCGMEESNIHFVYQCMVYKPVIEWFKMLLFQCCNFNPNMIKMLMLDIPNTEKREKNTCIILVATYITNIWIVRKAELTPVAAINLIKSKIMYNKFINVHRLRDKFSLVFTESYKTLEFVNR